MKTQKMNIYNYIKNDRNVISKCVIYLYIYICIYMFVEPIHIEYNNLFVKYATKVGSATSTI